MSTNAIATRSEAGIAVPASEITELQRLGGLFAASGYFNDAREMAQAAVKIQAGRELGIPPVASMMGINIIKGKVALGGNLIASRIRAHGYDYRHKLFDSTGCVLVFFGRPDAAGKRETLGESSFTDADAKTAGISSDMYKKFPRNMFFNRAISNGAKWYCPEVFAGAPIYVPEELGAAVDENGDMVHEEPRASSTKAQAEVADRKIREMKAGKTYAEVSSAPPAEVFTASDDDIPRELGGTSEPARLDLTQILRTRFSKFKDILEAFEQMKAEMIPVLGVECYYRILKEHGMEHANQFGTMANAKACFSALWGEMEAARPVEGELA